MALKRTAFGLGADCGRERNAMHISGAGNLSGTSRHLDHTSLKLALNLPNCIK